MKLSYRQQTTRNIIRYKLDSDSFMLVSYATLILWRRIEGEFVCSGSEITADFIAMRLKN